MAGVKQFRRLFEPGRIGNLEIKNRIIMAPMVTGLTEPDGRFSERSIDYFAARAKGGTGLILTEANLVETELNPPGEVPQARMDKPYHVFRAAHLVDAVHDYGARIGVQFTPGHGKNTRGASPKKVPIAPSAVPAGTNPSVLCRPMTEEEIQKIVRAFGEAAHRAVLAGFDLIEIHAHGGNLIDQFMSPLWNKRTDKYGGDIEGRLRFAVEIINAVRAKVGAGFPISFRYAAEQGIKGGRTLEESAEIVRRLEAAGLDCLHIDAGSFESPSSRVGSTYSPPGPFVHLAAATKQAVKIPVITVGSITSPEFAEQILAEGKADFICLGRTLLADPDWPNKARDGRVEDIRPCIRCNELCHQTHHLKASSCSVNPMLGQERHYEIRPADRPKKVTVIGGGPAGMEAARVAALRGHKVTLYEKEKELGGQMRAGSKPPFKSPIATLIDYLSTQMDKLGVQVKAGTEASAASVEAARPDALVVASGATPLIPPLPGIKNSRVITAVDLHLGKKKAGNEVLVAGGGLVGCEAALSLAQEGKKVTVVEMLPQICLDLNQVSRPSLVEALAKSGVTVLTNLTIKEFTADGLIATDKDGKQQTFKADTIVLALGGKPENKLAEKLQAKAGEVYVVGDCVSPRKIGEAMHEGFVAGWRI